MERSFSTSTTYFLREGRDNLEDCLNVAFEAAKQQGIRKIVIFTAFGEGVRLALENFCSKDEYKGINPIGITFPKGKKFTDAEGNVIAVDISPEDLALFQFRGVPLFRAHLPFDSIRPQLAKGATLGQDLTLLGEALNMFCGSMSLCVQAVALACDAGAVEIGEHVIALTSDTAILAQAAPTRRMLQELVIREILCKPVVLTIGKKETAEQLPLPLEGQASAEKLLTPGTQPNVKPSSDKA